MSKLWKWGFVAAAAALSVAGCGSNAAPTAQSHQSHPVPPTPRSTWHEVGTIPVGDRIVGSWEPGNRQLFMIMREPATANHGPAYVGMRVGADSLRPVTPPFAFGPNFRATAWGRTQHGAWWIAAVSGNDQVATTVWAPGDAAWKPLPPLVLAPPSGYSSLPAVDIARGRAGHGWLVANFTSSMGSAAQTTIYALQARGWQRIHTFPLGDASATNYPWATAGAVPGTLYVDPAAGGAVIVSRAGAIVRRIPIPAAIVSDWDNPNTYPPQNLLVVMASGGPTYAADPTGGGLWAWDGDQSQSLIGSQSSLGQNGYTWLGVWRGQPVIIANGTEIPYRYQSGQWRVFTALDRPNQADSAGIVPWAPVWGRDGRTIWALGYAHVWSRSGG